MILQALNDYYVRRQRSSDPRDRLPAFGLEEKEMADSTTKCNAVK